DLFRGPHFTVLALGEGPGEGPGEGLGEGLGEHDDATLSQLHTDIVKPYRVGPRGEGLRDDAGHVADAYGTDALILVRPDGYIGLVADPAQPESVAKYLRSL